MELKSFEIEDGVHEVVDVHPLRDRFSATTMAEIVESDAGGRMAKMRAAGDDARRRFLMIRTRAGVVKMSLVHVPVFRTLVRLWLAKRIAQVDPGVSLGEIIAAGETGARTPIGSLVRNGAVRRKVTCVGWQGNSVVYYPTSLGLDAIAIAEVLGEHSLVQVGGLANAWKGRNLTEPPSIFQIADLIRGGLPPEDV